MKRTASGQKVELNGQHLKLLKMKKQGFMSKVSDFIFNRKKGDSNVPLLGGY